jgi:hypothetical protein
MQYIRTFVFGFEIQTDETKGTEQTFVCHALRCAL